MAKQKYNVYSSMLGGYIAMGFDSREQAPFFIDNYHDKAEAKRMSISEDKNGKAKTTT